MLSWEDWASFRFEWPWAFCLLLLIPLWWFGYARYRRHQLHRMALHFSYTAVAAQIRRGPTLWKRLLYPVVVSMLMLCLTVSMARPTITARVPVRSADLMLVLDISLSMMATDIHPSRIEAAKQAGIHFIESLPNDMRVGLEVFAGNVYVLTPPTRNHREVIADLDALNADALKPRTEIGSALHTALEVLQETPNAGNAESSTTGNSSKPDMSSGGTSSSPDSSGQASSQEFQRLPGRGASPGAKLSPGIEARVPDRVIVLLSDGDSHEGYPWDVAAQDARQANVVIHTIGIGSPQGGSITYQGMELPVNFDETTLRRIADMAGGRYFRVFKEQDFRSVYEQIQARTIHYESRDLDLSYIVSGLALCLLVGALLLSLLVLI